MSGARLYTIPMEVSFVDALAAELLRRCAGDPTGLARTLVLLPTRRACRTLTEAFVRRNGGRPLLLPQMTPLGDVEEPFDDEQDGARSSDLDLPPAIPAMRRTLLLARLVLAGPGRHAPADQAVRLSKELARFLDQVQTDQLDLAALPGLAPPELAAHWRRTLDFLTVILDAWPKVLAEIGFVDPVARRNAVVASLVAAWSSRPPAGPVIAAGSTGSVPSTAALLAAVARLPEGAIVLPGLDVDADDATWEEIRNEPWHAQYGMARLLDFLGVDRRSVPPWPHPEPAAALSLRGRIVRDALRPACAPRAPAPDPAAAAEAMADVARIDAANPEEEARTIALILREVLEHPTRTGALVTPDRALARRVAAELQRWRILVDDTAGRPLAGTPAGTFIRLVAAMVSERFAPVPLLSVLKHPLAAAGLPLGRCRALTRRLERRALRGPRPSPGLDGVRAALDAEAPAELLALLEAIEAATAAMVEAFARAPAPISVLVEAHVAAVEAIAATDRSPGAARLWTDDAGDALASFFTDLRAAADDVWLDDASAYPALLDELMEGLATRPSWGRHPRLAILGPLEARLQRADVVVLGGLNEDVWPPKVAPSPWMSRPMMAAFGMTPPERRIGLSAHDFAEGMAAPTVYLTRSLRRDGSPTVASRFLLRLGAALESAGWAGRSEQAAARWLSWQRALDAPLRNVVARPPVARPPVAARPRSLPVTQIDVWMRDPYAVYARCVLKLRAREPIDAAPDGKEYGSAVHEALDAFLRAPVHLDPEVDRRLAALLRFGEQAFAKFASRPGVMAFWWPRFEQIARWFIAEEVEVRSGTALSLTEIEGSAIVRGPAGDFTLTAKADRIDLGRDGRLTLIDYKTGQIPTNKEFDAGYAPQLPLEAAIALDGGFPGLDGPFGPDAVAALEYWRLTGDGEGGCREVRDKGVEDVIASARARLADLIALFDDEATGYAARPRASVAPHFSDYEHLERVKEWAAGFEQT